MPVTAGVGRFERRFPLLLMGVMIVAVIVVVGGIVVGNATGASACPTPSPTHTPTGAGSRGTSTGLASWRGGEGHRGTIAFGGDGGFGGGDDGGFGGGDDGGFGGGHGDDDEPGVGTRGGSSSDEGTFGYHGRFWFWGSVAGHCH